MFVTAAFALRERTEGLQLHLLLLCIIHRAQSASGLVRRRAVGVSGARGHRQSAGEQVQSQVRSSEVNLMTWLDVSSPRWARLPRTSRGSTCTSTLATDLRHRGAQRHLLVFLMPNASPKHMATRQLCSSIMVQSSRRHAFSRLLRHSPPSQYTPQPPALGLATGCTPDP